MTFTLTPEARLDLLETAGEISRDNPERAESYIDELLDSSGQVADNPNLNGLRHEWGDAVRCARHGSYLILFEIEADGVVILRYLYGRRDITRTNYGEDK